MKLNRRNFLHTAGAALAAFLARWRGASKRKELDTITAMDYCHDDGKASMAGSDGEQSAIWRAYWDSGDDVMMWYEVGTAPRDGEITALYMPTSERWFAGYADGELWETSDAGETWKRQKYELVNEYRVPDFEIGGAS